MTVIVEKTFVDGYGGKYPAYIVCHDEKNPNITILVRNCTDETQNFVPGDVITVYGEGAGIVEVYDREYMPHSAPCVNVAYAILIEEV